jgi:hypothetical protein
LLCVHGEIRKPPRTIKALNSLTEFVLPKRSALLEGKTPEQFGCGQRLIRGLELDACDGLPLISKGSLNEWYRLSFLAVGKGPGEKHQQEERHEEPKRCHC